MAAPAHQYPIYRCSIQFQRDVWPGNDWCYFRVYDKRVDPTDPESAVYSPLDKQEASYRLARDVPAPDQTTLRLTGYG